MFNAKKFLRWGGILLIILAGLELVRFMPVWLWLTRREAWAYLVVGAISVVMSLTIGGRAGQRAAMIIGLVAFLLGLVSLYQSRFSIFSFAGTYETTFLFLFGAWGLLARRR